MGGDPGVPRNREAPDCSAYMLAEVDRVGGVDGVFGAHLPGRSRWPDENDMTADLGFWVDEAPMGEESGDQAVVHERVRVISTGGSGMGLCSAAPRTTSALARPMKQEPVVAEYGKMPIYH